MKVRDWFRSVWAGITAPQTDKKEVVIICRMVAKETDFGFLVTAVGCPKPEEHSATFKRVGDHYELGEMDVEAFGKCVLARAIRAVCGEPTVRVKLVDDHLYGFVD